MRRTIILIAILLSTLVMAQEDSTKVDNEVEQPIPKRNVQQRIIPQGTKLIFPGGLFLTIVNPQFSHIDSIEVKGKVYYHGGIDKSNSLPWVLLLIVVIIIFIKVIWKYENRSKTSSVVK